MRAWSKLSAAEKADIMKLAIQSGVYDLDAIRGGYNEYVTGGELGNEGSTVDLTPIDLSTMYANNKLYGNRFIDTTMLRKIDNYMLKNKVGLPQRQAIAYTVQQEGNTTGSHGNGAYGFVGWRGERAKNLPATVEGQARKLYDEVYGKFNADNWNHGGKGSGYNSGKEAQKAFQNAKTVEEATKAFNYGYVRPPLEDRVNRTKTSGKIFKKKEFGGNLFEDDVNEFKSGGSIYIKPENRGKFTRLKERTGHSASWFKEHGTPAQKKMAIFALNSRHWKHGLGGPLIEAANLYGGTTEDSQQMNTVYAPNGAYGLTSSSFMLPEVVVAGKNRKKSIPRQVLEAIKDVDLAYLENPSVMTAAGHTAKISEMHEPTKDERALGNTLVGIGLAGTAGLAAPYILGSAVSGINTVGDALAATAAGQRLTSGLNFVSNAVGSHKAWPWIDAGLTSIFGAHGIDKVRKGDIHNVGDVVETGLDLLPLAQLVRPVVNTAGRIAANAELYNATRKPIVPEGYTTINPNVRTRVGDVEIDNPFLTYRQGDASMGADFLNTGVVSMKNGSYENPMFAQGKLFYGSPSEVPTLLDPSLNATVKSKRGRVFLKRKPKDSTAKSDLLVSNIDMANANKDSHIISPYIRELDEEGNIMVTRVNEDIRRVPFAEEPATSKNTTLYRWEPDYGYKKIDNPESTYVVGNEIVDDAGNLNINVDDLLEQIKTKYPYTLNPEDLINKGINSSTDLSEHIQAVVQSAQTYPLPKGVSRKEFVTAALYHDLGKVFGDFGHGTNSAIIASELNLPITRNTIKAISQHMNQQEYFETASQLEKALHAADVGRGMKYETLIEKYPYLKYDIPEITVDNAASITPEQWTAAQDAAIARGDMAEAQRLRDLHADINGYNSLLSLYHGSPEKFNEFKAVPNFEGYVDYLSHFSVNPGTSLKFGDVRRFYTNVKNTLRVADQGARWDPSKLANELGIQPKYVKDPLEPYWREFQNIEGRGMYKEANRKFMKDELKGDAYIYDNIVEGGGDSYAIPTSRQVKLADAVTYDDKGVRIPLGERDNFKLNDIRYSWLAPFIGLGALGTLYGASSNESFYR